MSKSDTWPSHIASQPLSNMDSAGSCDSVISMNSACSEDSMEHLSPEERACLMFLEETIESLELQDDSGFSNEEPELGSHVEKMEQKRKDDISVLTSDEPERDQKSILSYGVPTQLSHLEAGPESTLESISNHLSLNHTPEPLLNPASDSETLDHAVPPEPPAADSGLTSSAPQMTADLLPPPSDFMDKPSSPVRPERLKYQHPSVGLSNTKPSVPVDLERVRQRAIAPSVNLEQLRQRAALRKTSMTPSLPEDPPSKLCFDLSQNFRPSSGSFSKPSIASDPPMTLPPIATDPPITLPPVASAPPMSPTLFASAPPMSPLPVASAPPMSPLPVASAPPMSPLPPIASAPPMSLPPVASELPMSLPPVASDLPMSLPSITYDPPNSLPPVTYDQQTSFPPVGYDLPTSVPTFTPDPSMSLVPESPEPKTPPVVAPKPKRLPANILLSYKTPAVSSEGNTGHSVPTTGDRTSLDHQKVHMEALRKLGLLKNSEEDSSPGLSPKSRRSFTDPSPPVSPAASNTPPMTPSYSRTNSSSPSALRPQSMSPAALLLSATSTSAAHPPPDFVPPPPNILPAPPAFSDFVESDESSPVTNVKDSVDAAVPNPPLTPTALLKQLSPPRVIGTKSATLERSSSRVKSYLTRKNCEGAGDEQNPAQLRSSRPRPASLGSRTQFNHGEALHTDQATSSGQDPWESPPSPTDSQHSNDSQKLPRSQGITVVISPRAENEEDRREALKKLGLLKD